MADKALISDLTWRTLESQKDQFSSMPIFMPNEIESMLRPTNRKTNDTIHIVSRAVVAKNEKDYRKFLSLMKARKAHLFVFEENEYLVGWVTEKEVARWKASRKRGASKVGGRISAERKKARVKEAATKIADRWPLPSKEHPTKNLLKEAGISLNSVKSVLGKRPIAQYNYQAAQKRKESRNAKR